MPIPWHERILEARVSRGIVETACDVCHRPMYLPRSKAALYRRCSDECRAAHSDALRLQRTRSCAVCGAAFEARQRRVDRGEGRYCSQKCNAADHVEQRRKTFIDSQDKVREMRRSGLIRILRGPDHPNWRGGRAASRARWVGSERQKETQRAYWKANPSKVKEWRHNRRGRKYGRLPTGTIKRIGALQKWRCAICRTNIRDAFQQDHIEPLARGGKHEPRNIQLLCEPCNYAKWAHDPIDHMRSLGRLL